MGDDCGDGTGGARVREGVGVCVGVYDAFSSKGAREALEASRGEDRGADAAAAWMKASPPLLSRPHDRRWAMQRRSMAMPKIVPGRLPAEHNIKGGGAEGAEGGGTPGRLRLCRRTIACRCARVKLIA